MHQQPSPSPSPETAGHEAPDDKHTGGAIVPSSAAASTAEERLNALVLSTPRAAGSSGLRASSAGASAARSTTTPLSSAKASRSAAVVGDGTFEELMKERARVSCSTGTCVFCDTCAAFVSSSRHFFGPAPRPALVICYTHSSSSSPIPLLRILLSLSCVCIPFGTCTSISITPIPPWGFFSISSYHYPQSSSFSTTLALLAMEATDEATEDTREMPETNVELRPIVVKPKY